MPLGVRISSEFSDREQITAGVAEEWENQKKRDESAMLACAQTQSKITEQHHGEKRLRR